MPLSARCECEPRLKPVAIPRWTVNAKDLHSPYQHYDPIGRIEPHLWPCRRRQLQLLLLSELLSHLLLHYLLLLRKLYQSISLRVGSSLWAGSSP